MVVQKLILSDFPLLWGPAVALNEKKPEVFDWLENSFTTKKQEKKIFYSPKESSLKNSPRGPIGRVAISIFFHPEEA